MRQGQTTLAEMPEPVSVALRSGGRHMDLTLAELQ